MSPRPDAARLGVLEQGRQKRQRETGWNFRPDLMPSADASGGHGRGALAARKANPKGVGDAKRQLGLSACGAAEEGRSFERALWVRRPAPFWGRRRTPFRRPLGQETGVLWPVGRNGRFWTPRPEGGAQDERSEHEAKAAARERREVNRSRAAPDARRPCKRFPGGWARRRRRVTRGAPKVKRIRLRRRRPPKDRRFRECARRSGRRSP